MYRNRARAAHKLQAAPPQQQQLQPQQQQVVQQQPLGQQQQPPASDGGWSNHDQQQNQQQVQFFNPSQYQNGGGQQQFQQPGFDTATAGSKLNNGGGVVDQQQFNGGEWSNNYNHNQVGTDPNQNNNNQQYINYNLNQQQLQQSECGGNVDQQDHQYDQQQQEGDNFNHQPELTLDPSGQWYWDYQQQQWFPYYQQQQQQEADTSVQEVTEEFQQLTTHEQQQPADQSFGYQQQQNEFNHHQDYHQNQQQEVLAVNGDNMYGHGVSEEQEVGSLNVRQSHDRDTHSQMSDHDSMRVARQDSQQSDRLRQDSQVSDTNLSHGHRPDSQLSEAAAANIPLDQVPPTASGLMPPSPAVASPSTPAAVSPAALISFSPGTPAVAASQAVPDLHQHPLGPPDLVDHRPNTSQPELVSDLSTSSGAGGGPPDLTSQSHHPPQSSPSLVSHDQHYEFYNQAYTNSQQGLGMPDVTGQPQQMMGGAAVGSSPAVVEQEPVMQLPQLATRPDVTGQPQQLLGGAAGPAEADQPHQLVHVGKAPDILRTEPVVGPPGGHCMVPSSDRNLFMETGELTEEDVARVNQDQAPPSSGPASLPPMVGGNEQVGPPPMHRMVVGDSQPPPMMPSLPGPPPAHQRMVEGDNDIQVLHIQPPPLPQQPPVSREVEGESHPGAPPPVMQQQPREPIEGESEPVPASGSRPQVPGLGPPPMASVPIMPPVPALVTPSDNVLTPVETRSEAAGSDRRDVDMMGPPTSVTRAPPPPTPGRDIAGEESGGSVFRRDTRDREHYDRDPYDSTDDRDNRDSDSGDRDGGHRYGGTRRRTVSPGSRSGHPRPAARIQDRSYRSSTDREDERKYGDRRRDDDRGYSSRKRSERDTRSYYDERRRREEQRRREEDEDDRRSYRGHNRDYRDRHRRDYIKQEPRDEYRDDRYSEYGDDRSSQHPSRPSSRAGSVSQYHDSSYMNNMSMNMSNMSMYEMMMQQQQVMLKAAMEQQMRALNPLQFQIQSAVAEMEKALDTPSNVMIYKQHWDYYSKTPGLLEKLKMEQPVQHHLLQHFRQNFWHLVENLEKLKHDPTEGVENQNIANNDQSRPDSAAETREYVAPRASDTFADKFGDESSIRAELEGYSTSGHVGDNSSHVQAKTLSPVLPERLTPLMFSRPHVCARISASGLLVKVEANNPQDGQTATIEVHSLSALLKDSRESQELVSFPGPLKSGETHKNDVIKFCERKIAGVQARRDIADKESYVLLWEMLVLLLRQKGQVEGSDLAELLLRNRDQHGGGGASGRSRAGSYRDNESISGSSVHHDDHEEVANVSRTVINSDNSTVDTVDKFRSYLLHGNKLEGLEYAMRVGLWGHALFLASKMDQRTYAGVMTRFANGLAINDPLQTLYQLMSARIPTAMKQCGDTRWGDWRPHLAMILSNTVTTDINRRSIITLGDSLLAKGQLYAAQFCYLVSEAEWGVFSNKCAKLVLLLSSASTGDKTLDQFATTEAIQCTEIYEFVQKLGNKHYQMPYLQPYKYLHMLRLLEAGYSTRAQDYTRVLAEYVSESVSAGHGIEQVTVPNWVNNTLYLAEKLKYLDPVYTTSSGEITEISDPAWLGQLSTAVSTLQYSDYQGYAGYTENQGYSYNSYDQTSYDHNTETVASAGDTEQTDQPQYYQQQVQQHEEYSQQQSYEGQVSYQDPSQQPVVDTIQSPDQDQQPPSEMPEPEVAAPPPALFNPADVGAGGPPTFFNPAALPSIPEQPRKNSLSRQGSVQPSSSRKNSEARSRQASESTEVPPPVTNSYYGSIKTIPSPTPSQNQPPPMPAESMKSSEKKDVKKKEVQDDGGGNKKKSWLGGMFSKVFKKDQVHLPDDKDKRIVFDEKTGKWVNLDADEDESAPAPPPPMDPAFSQPQPAAAGSSPAAAAGQPPAAPINFRAGLTSKRGRGYVDVLSQSGMSKPVSGPAMVPNGAPPSSSMAPPAMLTPSGPVPSQDGPSSLTTPAAADDGPSSMPMMFNPSSMGTASMPPNF